jgi:Transposase DDE domain.
MKSIRYEFVEKPVTAWGGMRMMKELIDRTGIKEFIEKLPLPKPGSNRGYSPIQIVESFWVSIWIGASRFAHSGWLRYDKVLKDIFGRKEAPSQSTYSRFFGKFSWKLNNEIFTALQQWFMESIKIEAITLDLDSTVLTRYGEQEGSKVGYNRQKPGRASHHRLIAFMAETRMVINAWLRAGNTVAISNIEGFLEETLKILSNIKIGLIRADSGFYADKFLRYFERREINYIVSVKLYKPIRDMLEGLSGWINLKDGIQIKELRYRAAGWKEERRFIIVRKNIEKFPKATGKLLLFDESQLPPIYRYSVFVTNLDLPAEQIWNMYKDRGDSENRVKELKYDFAIDGFCMKKFWATEASFRMIMVAYNLMSLFRQMVLQENRQSTLNTIKFKCFALGSWIVKSSREKVLKISTAGRKRLWLEGLFSKVNELSPPYLFSNA